MGSVEQMLELMADANIPKPEIGIVANEYEVAVGVSGVWPDGTQRNNARVMNWQELQSDDGLIKDCVFDQIEELSGNPDRWPDE